MSALLKTKSFGKKKAQKIEAKCDLPSGWLDKLSDAIEAKGNVGLGNAPDNNGINTFKTAVIAHTDAQDFIQITKVRLPLSAGITEFQTEPESSKGLRWR